MSRITVELDGVDALLAQGALDKRAADAYREMRRLTEKGDTTSTEYVIAASAARSLDRASRAIAAALYPEQPAAQFGWDS